MATPSLIGAPKGAVDTPALLVDLVVMEANIGRVAEILPTMPRPADLATSRRVCREPSASATSMSGC
jgi:hypothetical protein